MTVAMAEETKKQGENLNQLEDHVVEAKTNALKAENEIAEANKIAKGNSRKLCCIFFIIFFVVAALVTILLLILLPKKDS